MEDSAGDVEFYIAIGLTKGCIIAGCATIWFGRIITVGSTPTCKDTILAIEFSAIDDQRNSSIFGVTIYITTRFTRSTGIGPQSRTHISATSGIDTINLLIFRTEDTTIDDNLGVGISWIHNFIFMLIGVVACIADQVVLCHIIRTVKHHLFAGVVPICDSIIRSMVSISSDTIHTTCSCTKDAAEDIALLGIAFWKNREGSAVDGDGAVAIEWVVDFYIARMSTSHTTAIKFGNNYAAVYDSIIIIFRMCWVEGDVGSTHIGVARKLIGLISIGEFQFCLCSQGSVYDASHLTTPDDDIHIGIHRTLVVSGKDDTGIIVVRSFYTINGFLLVVGIVPCSVDIHCNGTFDRLGWSSHHTIEFRH